MSAWLCPLLCSLTMVCLTGIALGQTTSTGVPIGSTPAPPSTTSTGVPSTTSTGVPIGSTPAPPSTTSTGVPIGSTPAPPSAAPAPASAPPAAAATLSAGLTATTAGPAASTAAPSADPSTKTPAQTLPSTTGTVPTSQTSALAATSSSVPASPPGVTPSPGLPSSALPPSTPQPSNCSTENVTACFPCPPGTAPTQASQGALCAFPAHQDILLMSLGLQPAGPVSEAIIAPSKMQLFVCLASQDPSASTFKGANDSRCKACRTGEYQLQRGKESCEQCPENHYCPSPDVKPVKCPPDAFCPRGSVEPTYCMELFLYKAGDSCQLTPATVIVLATFSAGGILVVFLIILRSRQEHGRSSLKSPLLPRGSGLGSYGGTEHTEPVYAGW
ncbi:uncharacterized protein LOC106629338 isoform X2 [Zonotrichia albicollis]|uniref:uncharacterized protein LOC106629338 isoform X2 n=1 Tax=Zonotrichia albicollis TaxID=44394 RepID=UPI003D80D713